MESYLGVAILFVEIGMEQASNAMATLEVVRLALTPIMEKDARSIWARTAVAAFIGTCATRITIHTRTCAPVDNILHPTGSPTGCGSDRQTRKRTGEPSSPVDLSPISQDHRYVTGWIGWKHGEKN